MEVGTTQFEKSSGQFTTKIKEEKNSIRGSIMANIMKFMRPIALWFLRQELKDLMAAPKPSHGEAAVSAVAIEAATAAATAAKNAAAAANNAATVTTAVRFVVVAAVAATIFNPKCFYLNNKRG